MCAVLQISVRPTVTEQALYLVKTELERVQEESEVTSFELLCRNLPGGTEEYHKNIRIAGIRFEFLSPGHTEWEAVPITRSRSDWKSASSCYKTKRAIIFLPLAFVIAPDPPTYTHLHCTG